MFYTKSSAGRTLETPGFRQHAAGRIRPAARSLVTVDLHC